MTIKYICGLLSCKIVWRKACFVRLSALNCELKLPSTCSHTFLQPTSVYWEFASKKYFSGS